MSTPTGKHQRAQLEQQQKCGALWCCLIAGLSMLNSLLLHTGHSLQLGLGLGLTQVVDALLAEQSGAMTCLALGVNGGMAMLLAALGYTAQKRRCMLVVGMGLYTLDSVLCIFAGDWPGLGLHAFVLWGMWGGYVAAGQLADCISLERDMPVAQPAMVQVVQGQSTAWHHNGGGI